MKKLVVWLLPILILILVIGSISCGSGSGVVTITTTTTTNAGNGGTTTEAAGPTGTILLINGNNYPLTVDVVGPEEYSFRISSCLGCPAIQSTSPSSADLAKLNEKAPNLEPTLAIGTYTLTFGTKFTIRFEVTESGDIPTIYFYSTSAGIAMYAINCLPD